MARQVGARCVTTLFCFPADLRMAGRPNPFPMGVSDPFLARYVIWFGSLEFRATGNGYLMERLPPRVSSDVPAPPRHQSRTGTSKRYSLRSIRLEIWRSIAIGLLDKFPGASQSHLPKAKRISKSLLLFNLNVHYMFLRPDLDSCMRIT